MGRLFHGELAVWLTAISGGRNTAQEKKFLCVTPESGILPSNWCERQAIRP